MELQFDALHWINEWIEVEANSANDNPLLEPQTREVLTTGNLYGGHIAFAMDALKTALASVADMSDQFKKCLKKNTRA